MAKSTGFFDSLYRVTQEAKDALQKPFVEKKVRRGFESAIDSLEIEKLEAESRLNQCREDVANGNVDKIKDIAKVRYEIERIEHHLTSLKDENERFF